jgi:RNA polymerase sigma-70 factor (ECF subfamily)
MVAAINKVSNEDLIKNEIISKVREGSHDAFEEIVRSYQKRVFILAYGILMNREDAMEVTQETFLKLFKSLSSLRDDAKFEPWLFTIANNLCIDKLRKNKKLKLQSVSIDDIPEGVAVADQTPEDEEYEENLKQTIKNTIHTLPARQRTIVVMRYFQELKFHEIADNLGISLGTVKKLHFTALEKIRARTLKPGAFNNV